MEEEKEEEEEEREEDEKEDEDAAICRLWRQLFFTNSDSKPRPSLPEGDSLGLPSPSGSDSLGLPSLLVKKQILVREYFIKYGVKF